VVHSHKKGDRSRYWGLFWEGLDENTGGPEAYQFKKKGPRVVKKKKMPAPGSLLTVVRRQSYVTRKNCRGILSPGGLGGDERFKNNALKQQCRRSRHRRGFPKGQRWWLTKCQNVVCGKSSGPPLRLQGSVTAPPKGVSLEA